MKKFLLISLAVFFVACGNSPESVAKKFYESASTGDVNGVVECLVPKQQRNSKDVKGKAQMMVSSATSKTKERGGLSSVSAKTLDEDGDSAKVEIQMKFKDGSSKTETVRLHKYEGEWLIKH